MRNTLETRLGVFVALAVLAAVLIIETIGGTESFRRSKQMEAMFNGVQELKVGDRVKMGGVEIGRVKDIKLTNNQVMVVMKIRSDRSQDVKTDSVATVKFAGLMGQNYVAISFGLPASPPAAEYTLLATAEQPDLSAIMVKLDSVATGVQNLTKSFTGDKIDNLFGPFTDFLKQNSAPLTATIANIQSISSQISHGQGTVGKLIYDESLYNSAMASVTNLEDAASQIKTTIADAHKVVDQINAGQGTVGKLVKDDTLYNETTAFMTNMREISQKINQGQGTIGKLVNDQEFYKNAKLTLQKLDKATEGLEDQGPLSVLGIVVNSLL